MVKTDIQDIPVILERLASVSSTNEKKRILEETKSNELEYIFKQTYDSFINFGTVKVDIRDIKYSENKKVDKKWLSSLTLLLYKLENRELTGNEARDKIKIFLSEYPESWGKVVLNILKKDLRIGAGKRLINHVYENLFSADFCMAAMKYDKKRISYPIYADTKLDGVRCIADYNFTSKKVNLFSRNGRLFKNYSTIENEIRELGIPSIRLDGEIVSSHFQKLMRTVSRKEGGIELAKDVIYNIFDVPLNNVVFSKRLEILNDIKNVIKEKNLLHLKVVIGKKIENEEELLDFYEEQIEKGNEGIMIKGLNDFYEYKRTYSWQKMKNEETIDLKIVDFQEGTGKYSGKLGAFICKLPNGNLVNVGSGFEDSERIEYWEKRKELLGQVIEIKFQEKTLDDSLRFPVFLRLRPDKNK